MFVGHVEDRLVHKRVHVDVFRGHEHDALHDVDGVTLTAILLLEFREEPWCLIRGDARHERRIVNLLHHELLRSNPYGDGEDDFVFEVDALACLEAGVCLCADDVDHWFLAVGRCARSAKDGVVDAVEVALGDAG